MKIEVTEVLALYSRLEELNSVPFDQIEWIVKGNPMEVSAKDAEVFKLTGLSNTNFVTRFLSLKDLKVR